MSCPANSHSSARGASICPCQGGFHRADSDPPESICTSKSSPGGREGKKEERKMRCLVSLDWMIERRLTRLTLQRFLGSKSASSYF